MFIQFLGRHDDKKRTKTNLNKLHILNLQFLVKNFNFLAIYHFHFLPGQVTWTGSTNFCEDLSLLLCNSATLFPQAGVMQSVGFQSGDNWVPVR